MNTLAENAASGNTRGRRRLARVAGLALLIIALLGALLAWFNLRGEQGVHAYGHGGWSGARETPAALIERGAYLARVGNCAGCHTAAGGAEYAGVSGKTWTSMSLQPPPRPISTLSRLLARSMICARACSTARRAPCGSVTPSTWTWARISGSVLEV